MCLKQMDEEENVKHEGKYDDEDVDDVDDVVNYPPPDGRRQGR